MSAPSLLYNDAVPGDILTTRIQVLVTASSTYFEAMEANVGDSGATCCGVQDSGSDPVPFINQPLAPTSTTPGGPGFTLTGHGTGFTSGATVKWNDAALATIFVSSEELKATVPAANIASPGTASVTVVNPGSALISNVASFAVTAPTPTVTFRNASGSPTAAGTNPFLIAAGDFNGDGKLDLAVVNFDQTMTILLGNGDGTFAPVPSSPATGVWPNSIAVGDFNRDGKLDLAVANQNRALI